MTALTLTRRCRFCGFEAVQRNPEGDLECLLCTRLQSAPIMPALPYLPYSERRGPSAETRAKLAAGGLEGRHGYAGEARCGMRDAGCECLECGE